MKLVTKLSVKRYSAHVNRIWSIIANSMLSLTRSPILDHLYLGPVQYLSNHFLQMKDKSRWQEYLPCTVHSRGKKHKILCQPVELKDTQSGHPTFMLASSCLHVATGSERLWDSSHQRSLCHVSPINPFITLSQVVL